VINLLSKSLTTQTITLTSKNAIIAAQQQTEGKLIHMSQIRVLMISKACIVGIYQRKLEYIAQQGIELLVIVPPSWHDERGNMLLERVYTDGYQLETLPIRFNGKFHLHSYSGLGKRIKQSQPDIVHIDEEPYNLATWQALFYARKNNAKSLFFTWQNINRRYPPPFRWAENWVMNNVDYALTGTQSATDVLRQKGYAGQATVIPQFGTDAELFMPANRPQRPFTIGFAARLVEEKGIYVLLDAVAALSGHWQLRILGGGPLLDDLQAKVQNLNLSERVLFDGQIASTEMPDYYHNLDVLVLPSLTRPNWKEQFGRVLVEAMASGIPIIGSDSGAIPGVIGDGGLIVPEGDSVALTNALERMMNDPVLYDQLLQNGRKRFLEHFTHEQIALDTVRVYREMMDE
jgi:glycosyltransferase involved in cell wall biosynthesis